MRKLWDELALNICLLHYGNWSFHKQRLRDVKTSKTCKKQDSVQLVWSLTLPVSSLFSSPPLPRNTQSPLAGTLPFTHSCTRTVCFMGKVRVHSPFSGCGAGRLKKPPKHHFQTPLQLRFSMWCRFCLSAAQPKITFSAQPSSDFWDDLN